MTLLYDFRWALRNIRKNIGFSLVTIFTLTLGIGATTAIFSLVNGVLLNPLPYADAGRLVWAFGTYNKGNKEGTSAPDFFDFRKSSTRFENLAAATRFTAFMSLTGHGDPQQVTARYVSSGFLEMLKVRPVLGREFQPADEKVGGPHVCMLSYGLWRRVLGADNNIIGSTVNLDNTLYTVIGVNPPLYDFLGATDLWVPMQLNIPALRRVRFLTMLGRIQPGVTVRGAESELNTLAAGLERQFPVSNKTWRIRLAPLSDELVSNVRQGLMMLMGAVVFVLLIVAANVANLMLSWAAARRTETAVRSALGASRAKIAQEVLAFSLTLALIGGAFGCVLAVWAVGLIKRFGPSSLPRLADVGVDSRILLFAFAVSVVTGLLFGIVPAIRISKLDLSEALKSGARTSGGNHGVRNALVVAEVAVSMVLLIGAGLLIRSLGRLSNVDPGFRTANMLVTRIAIPITRYGPPEKRIAFWRSVVDTVKTLPGVEDAAIATELPLSGQDNPAAFLATTQSGSSFVVNTRGVSPNYLSMLGAPLKEGRAISALDQPGTQPVVVINEVMKREIFGNANPIGQKLTFDFGPYSAYVVGVVGNIRHASLAAQPFRECYFPEAQTPLLAYNLVVHTKVDAKSAGNAVRRAVWMVDPAQSVGNFQTLDDFVQHGLAQPAFRSLILALFAVLAVVLASVGLYGVLSYLVSQRIQEIGVRVAIGATAMDILRLIVGKGMELAGIGLLVGVAAAALVTRLISSLLFGVSGADPVTFVAGALVLGLVALLASYIPGRRAAAVNPITALRIN